MAKKKHDIWDAEDLANKQEQYLQAIQDFCILDDVFMKVVFKDTDCVKYVLDTILDDDLTILESNIEVVLPNLHGRGARLDVWARDSKGKQINLEFQRDDSGAQPKRARRNRSLLDSNFPDSGKDGEDLPETFIIFVTEGDPLHDGLPIYHIHSRIDENGKLFDEGTHIIYVTASIQNENTKLGRLMHDLTVKSAAEMHPSVLAERVQSLKETKEGQYTMSKVLEDLQQEAFAKGIERGIARSILTLAKTMSAEKIAEALELSPDFVREVLA